jgi:RNA-directed DNA polymerase
MPAPDPLFTRADVARLLEVSLPTLTWWTVASPPVKRYKQFGIERRNGGERTIHAPVKPLKDLQGRLADRLSARYEAPEHVHGFVPGRSAVSNAQSHRNRKWVLRVDLANFFPSINFGRVRGLFMSYPFDFGEPAATLMAQICCFEGSLPQGAPTSPVVSNFICHSLDKDLARLALGEDCSVSRYADDLCFSTDRDYFPERLAHPDPDTGKTIAGEAIVDLVQGNGFAINPEKTRLMRKTQRQRVTGLVVNEKANVPRNYARDLRNLLYIWKRHGEADAIAALRRRGEPRNWPPGKPGPDFKRVVRGRVQHVGRIRGWTSSSYLSLAKTLEEVDDGFVLRHEASPAVPSERRTARLFTEGKSDVDHMLAAQRHFHRNGEFTEVELVADASSAKGGASKLLRHCKTLAEALAGASQPPPSVCLFDSDDEDMLKRAVGSGNWRDWGNGVVAVALVDRDGHRACIETLYDESVREIEDSEGRRLFLMSEFKPTGLHQSRAFTTPHPDKEKLVPDSVYDVETDRSVGLTKVNFGKAILNEEGDFATVSFDGLRPTFEAIREALAKAAPPGGATN